MTWSLVVDKVASILGAESAFNVPVSHGHGFVV